MKPNLRSVARLHEQGLHFIVVADLRALTLKELANPVRISGSRHFYARRPIAYFRNKA